MEDKLVINIHGIKMEGVVLWGKANGQAGGPPTVEPSKEIWKKKLKKVRDRSTRVPLIMSDLTSQGKEVESKDYNFSDVPSN